MGSDHVKCKSRTDATPEAEYEALSTVYRFVLDCHARKEAAEQSGPNDAKETHHARARSILPR
jgi:hypothetical protein